MPVDPPFIVYRDQLTALSHGLALWNPDPPKQIYNNVSIGDVGYLQQGRFFRMFNVIQPWDHPSNGVLGELEPYDPLDCGPFTNEIDDQFDKEDHYSRFVTAETNAGNKQAMTPADMEGVTYKFRNRGALLSLPNGGRRKEVIRTKVFEEYIRDHVDEWFNWAQNAKLSVECMEDLILVSGCTLVTSWAAAVFVDNASEAEISLASRSLSNVRANFVWGNVQGHVLHHNSRFDPQDPRTMADQCVFIKGFRAKRILFWARRIVAAAEPRLDDPDNRSEDGIQVSRVPGAPKYRDPLVGVLDYIAETCQTDNVEGGILAIVHHDDLQLIDDVETLTADEIEECLHRNQMPLLVENGAAILRDPVDDEPPVSDEKKAVFYAAAELNGEPVPLVIHPVLTKYNLKLEMDGSFDGDYDIPKEDMISPAVHPPVLSLNLESRQGYPQIITAEASSDTQSVGGTVQKVLRTLHENLRMPFFRRELSITAEASSDTQSVGVTVQKVLRTLHEDLRKPFSRRELRKLGAEERAGIYAAFRERCKSEKELGKGPRRIDHLGGRDRLQILPKFGHDGSELIPTSRDESRVADNLGRHMTIDMLPDDVLLEIFDHDRLAAQEYALFGPWEWHRLAHVCQGWRSVIFASPHRLNLRLVYTYKKPVRKDVECWPPLPISIWYPRLVLYHPLSPADEANVISALEFPDRICEINLTLTRPLLEKLTSLKQDPFPALKFLQLGSRDLMESVVLSSGFLGGSTPRLRHIDLDGIPFPTLPLFLLFATDLAYLRLYEIPNTGYFSPEALVSGLNAKPDLEYLEIHFLHPTSDLGRESPRSRPNSPTHVLLPALTEFQFRGDNAYLENLITTIDAPNLERFGITLFEQHTFELPQLAQFIGRTERLKSSPYRTSIWFWDRGFTITHYFGPPSSGPTFRLEISCPELARQVILLSGICEQLSLLVSSVERLDIEMDHVLSDAWDDEASVSDSDSDRDPDSGAAQQWLELLAPFRRVRWLELIGTPVPSIASALEKSAAGNGCREVLPSLQSLHLRGPTMSRAIESFAAARQRSGHVVSVHLVGEESP